MSIRPSIDPTTLPRLDTIAIGFNRVGDEGAEALASMMSAGSVPLLKDLGVQKNGIGPKGLQAIADAVASGEVPLLTAVNCKKNLGDDMCVQEAVQDAIDWTLQQSPPRSDMIQP